MKGNINIRVRKNKRGEKITIERKAQARHKPAGNSKVLIILIFVFACLISLASIAAIVILFSTGNHYIAEGVEATLLATGLSVIGLAIAVWTGMNISNAIQRKEVDELQDRVDELSRTSGQLKETSQAVAQTISYLDAESLFLQEILRTEEDYTSTYLYYLFSANKKLDVDWGKLIEIERLFVKVQKMYRGLIKKDSALWGAANHAIELIKDFPSKDDKRIPDAVQEYLYIREADFCFYKGYVADGYTNILNCFSDAIDIYFSFLKLHKADEDFLANKLPAKMKDDQRLAAYIANTLGVAYGYIARNYVHYNNLYQDDRHKRDLVNGSPKNAIKYGELAVQWAQGTTFMNDEFIYRNFGAAYEWLDQAENSHFAHYNEVFANYKKAFACMTQANDISEFRRRKVYYVLLSYYKKYIEKALGIEYEKDYTVNVNKGLSLPSYEIEELLSQFIQYSDYALSNGHKYGFVINLNGFAYCYVALAEKLYGIRTSGVTNQECLEKAKSALNTLELIGRTDGDNEAYYNQLKKCRELL